MPEITTPERLRIGAVLLLTVAVHADALDGRGVGGVHALAVLHLAPRAGAAKATGEGRVAEFSQHGWDVSQMIDPQDPDAYHSAVLDWTEPTDAEHAAMLSLYRSLIALRLAEPDLRDPDLRHVGVAFDEDARWIVVTRGSLRIAVNFADDEQRLDVAAREVVLATGPGDRRRRRADPGTQYRRRSCAADRVTGSRRRRRRASVPRRAAVASGAGPSSILHRWTRAASSSGRSHRERARPQPELPGIHDARRELLRRRAERAACRARRHLRQCRVADRPHAGADAQRQRTAEQQCSLPRAEPRQQQMPERSSSGPRACPSTRAG